MGRVASSSPSPSEEVIVLDAKEEHKPSREPIYPLGKTPSLKLK